MIEIKTIIESLGYSDSNDFYYGETISENLNEKIPSGNKILYELNPVAYYLIKDKPFILFFECYEKQISKELIKKIWNAQIPLAIVVFENRVEIFNGCALEKESLVLLESIKNIEAINKDTPFSYWKVSDASFWKNYIKKLSKAKLDSILLENIKVATNKIKESACEPFAVKLVLRLLFIRFLIDRGVDLNYSGLRGDVKNAQDHLLRLIKEKKTLYALFAYLKKQFNGNLFEVYEEKSTSEIDLLDDEILKILYDLLSGNLVLSSGQHSLFPMYDFNIIPVELISNIYERFLGSEKQKDDKAFYTPPYLVDYLLKQTVIPSLSKNNSCKILDPACGSGIFLVEAARRIIEKRMKDKPNGLVDKELVECVTDSIWGIDINPEAIDVAIFSIYLTILDYKDPKSLIDFKLPPLKGENLFVTDFFSEEVDTLFHEKKFDFIIGNPPWGKTDGPHIAYCKKNKLPIHRNEISRSFVLRAKDFVKQDACCCMIVTSKLLYNTERPAKNFRKWLLEETKVIKYIELAAVRELIFQKVKGPAGVIIYSPNSEKEKAIENELCHLTLKPNIFFKLFNVIVIEKNDYKYVEQNMLLENDWAWKTLVFGYAQDFHIINILKKKYPSFTEIMTKHNLFNGNGIQINGGDQKDARHLHDRKLIDAREGIHPFYINTNYLNEFNIEKIHRPRERDIFRAPYMLMKKGFDRNTFRYRSVYSEEDFVYPDAITGICGEKKDATILKTLTGLFNSSVYSYLNLMMGSASGIEREESFPTEIFNKFPALDDDQQIVALVEDIQKAVLVEKELFNNSTESDKLIQELDALVLEKFSLQDDMFVDYALNIQIPLIAKNQLTWKKVTSKQLVNYAEVFIEYFDEIFQNGEKFVRSEVCTPIAGHFSVVEFFLQDAKPEAKVKVIEVKDDDDIYTSFISNFMLNIVNDQFFQVKDILHFREDSFFVLKTEEWKNWHPAMAKLDLIEVLDSIIAGEQAAPE